MSNLVPTLKRETRRAPDLTEVEGWRGWRVDDLNGSLLGEVESVLTDGDGAPAWLVVCAFRSGEGRRCAIPVTDAVPCEGRVWTPHPRERIRGTIPLLAGEDDAGERARRLREHYARSQRRFAA